MESKQSIQNRHAQGVWSELDAQLLEYDKMAEEAQAPRMLHIDIETKCELDLTEVGVWRYASHPSFKIDIFGYRYHDGETTTVLDTHADTYPAESIPQQVWEDLHDPNVIKIAQNAAFEITCIYIHYGLEVDFKEWLKQWYCVMIASAYYGLPMNLDKIGAALRLKVQKDKNGKKLINFFTQPVKKGTKKTAQGEFNDPADFPEKWQQFLSYNGTDVDAEVEIFDWLYRLPPLPAIEWHYWRQDQIINNRGIYIDATFARAAVRANQGFIEGIHAEVRELTGVENPNSLDQLKEWLTEQLGEEVTTLTKDSIIDALASEFLPDNVRRLYELRDAASNTSVSKYATMLNYMSPEDGRVRNLIQFYGANRTGRYAGRAIQIQNLKKMLSRLFHKGKDFCDERVVNIRKAIVQGLAFSLFPDVSDLISQLVRTAFVAPPGKKLISCDFAAIEARVLAWLAGEEWVLDVFRTHGKLYEATAAKMFNVPFESIGKGSPYRSKGKVASLALGYQGWSGALIQMGALREGLTEEELPPIAKAWRKANPAIVKFWKELENSFRVCCEQKRRVVLRKKYTTITFIYERGYVFIVLPSGRRLSYFGAHVSTSGKLVYWGMHQQKKTWVKQETYGGKLAENITQAVARDCLVESMDAMFDELDIIFHVHDEIAVEEDQDQAEEALKLMRDIMAVSPVWAPDLPLTAEGYISDFYKKD